MGILMAVTIIYGCKFCSYLVYPLSLTLLSELESGMRKSGGPEIVALGEPF